MSLKEYICMECNIKFQREEKIQQQLYKEMGICADQCEQCLKEQIE